MQWLKEEGVWIYAECEECGMVMRFRRTLLKQEQDKYKLSETIECFCGNSSGVILNASSRSDVIAPTFNVRRDVPSYDRNIPRCPTCGSSRIEKISVGSKVAGAAMIGIFSSNIRKTYKCKNCGYKW